MLTSVEKTKYQQVVKNNTQNIKCLINSKISKKPSKLLKYLII